MATYKNIRIKMKGGKSRLQRVKVLASGKYKFVKNLTKRGRKTPTRRTRRKSNPGRKRGVRRMARKKRSRGGKSPTRTLFKLVRLGALAAPAIHTLAVGGSTEQKIENLVWQYTGYSLQRGTWEGHALLHGWGPYLGAVLTTYGIPKIAGIIRKL